MMREQYNLQLQQLHDEMTQMGGMCEQAIAVSIQTLLDYEQTHTHPDSEVARQISDSMDELEARVFALDGRIDEKEREIEALCTKLLLRQQPVAGDLREITAALKMISDMERIGDQASDIAEIALFIKDCSLQHKIHLKQMATEAIRMVSDSVAAFTRRDLALARAVITHDDVVDGWFDRIKKELAALIEENSGFGEYTLDLLMVAKYLERIGDHATNIAEWVEYSITGQRSKNGVFPE